MLHTSLLDERKSPAPARRQRRPRQPRRHRYAQHEKKDRQIDNKVDIPSGDFDEGEPDSNFILNGTDSLRLPLTKQHDRNSHSDQHCNTRQRRRRNKFNKNETNTRHVNIDNTRSSIVATTSEELCSLHHGILDKNVEDNATNCSTKTPRKRRGRTRKKETPGLTTANVSEPTSSFAYAQFTDRVHDQVDEVDLDLDSSFPMLPLSSAFGSHDVIEKNTFGCTRNDLLSNAESSWSERVVTRILTTSSVDQYKVDQAELIEDESSVVEYNSSVPLTRLTHASNQRYDDDLVAKSGRETLDSVYDTDRASRRQHHRQQEGKAEETQETEQPVSNFETLQAHGNSARNLLLPNIKGKWSEAQLARMRQRWWDAERSKRRTGEQKRRKAEVFPNDKGGRNSDSFNGSTSSSSLSLSSTSSSFDISIESDVGMQPPSLSEPFDELKSTTPNSQCVFHHSESSSVSQRSPVSERIMNLEKECLQSQHPLHIIVSYCYGMQHQRRKVNDDSSAITASDEETVLCRLLQKQDAEEVAQWKTTTLDPKDFIPLDENARLVLDIPLRSADLTRLTPLQLAILLDLPKVVRILLFNPSRSSSEDKVNFPGMGEDEFGRTPLMLACELHRLECIEICLSLTKPKLDHREHEWGNSAYHFCCLGKMSASGTRWHSEAITESTAADAISILFHKTPYPSERRILMSINNGGQNLLHLACASGDLRLVDCILEHLNSRGHNLVVKALNTKDRNRCVPFISAVVADARDIAMHLLVSRLANRSDFSTWFAGCPLTIASSNDSVEMVRMLLEVGHPTVYDTNRALLEALRYRTDTPQDEWDGCSEARCEIISLLISSGANPHLQVAASQLPEQHLVKIDRVTRNNHLKGKTREGVAPLTVAVCSGDVEGVKTMLTSYALALPSIRSSRRSDPILRLQPESYFQTLEKREDDVVESSLQSALVNSLFQWWKHRKPPSAKIAFGLYRRGVQLSQKSMQWLANCLRVGSITPAPLNSFQSSSTIFRITSEYKPKSDLNHDVDTHSIDWSKVLPNLDWFKTSVSEVRCKFVWQLFHSQTPFEPLEDLQRHLKDDEFYLIVENEKIIAHKSIIAAKSGKLAAAIHFNEAQRESNRDLLSVQIDLPLTLAKMLLTHIYHGSILFGLKTTPANQCHQLLELALLADEYLCPTLIVECEMRLLKHGSRECICSRCSDSYITKADQIRSLVQKKCLEDANAITGENEDCKITGVYECKPSSFIDSPSSGLITPETVLDVLAVAQHMVKSSSAHHGFYGMKYFKYEGMDLCPTTATVLLVANDKKEFLSAPFLAVNLAAVSVVLKTFKAVINSDSYLQKIHGDKERIDKGALDPSAMNEIEESSVLLLSLCLDALRHNPFIVKDDQNCHVGINDFLCSSYLCF